MINPEGLSIPESELTGKAPEKAEKDEKRETPAEYARELRNKIMETSAQISDLERQRKLKAEIITQERNIDDLKQMIKEYHEIDSQISRLEIELNDVNIALEATAELGIELPKADTEEREFEVDISDLEENISETMEIIAEVTAMNELLIQRENLKKQMKEAGASKDEEKFNQLADSYILLCKEIDALTKKELNAVKKVAVLREIKKIAA